MSDRSANNVAECAFSDMSRVLSEFQFLGRLMQVCEASLCPSPGGPSQHVHEPLCSRSDMSLGQPRAGTSGPGAPRGSPTLNVPPGACWSGLTPQTPLTCWPWASGPPAVGHVRALTPHKGKQTSPVGASGSLLLAGVFQKLSQKRGVCTPWELPHSLF